MLLFLGWQLWFNSLVVGAAVTNEARELAQGWVDNGEGPVEVWTPAVTDDDVVPPPVLDPVGHGQNFANLIVPRFGAGYDRPIAEGVTNADVLDTGRIGRYPGTQMPGEVGNFAVAAHRTTYGESFNRIGDLQIGDRIYVETQDGWYVYGFRNLEYVRPTGVGVLNPVPQTAEIEVTDRILTLTSCNPMFSLTERIIAYALLEEFVPRSVGAPSEIETVIRARG